MQSKLDIAKHALASTREYQQLWIDHGVERVTQADGLTQEALEFLESFIPSGDTTCKDLRTIFKTLHKEGLTIDEWIDKSCPIRKLVKEAIVRSKR